MKLLIIGATGQVACSLLEKQPGSGHEMVAMEPPELDFGNNATIDAAVENVGPDLVINAAAYTAVDNAEDNKDLAFTINRDGPAHLASVCAERDIPLIHISTDYVFDGSKEGAYTEDDPASPLGVYGISKYQGDMAVIAAAPKHIIVRTAWVFSPFGNNFAKTMLRLAETRDELNVVDDQRGSPSYAPHIAQAILSIIEKLEQGDFAEEPWGLYNLAGSGDTSWCGLAAEIFARSKKHGGPTAIVHPITTQQYPTPAERPANSRLDCAKLARVFGVNMPDWRDATAQCVALLVQPKD